MDLLVQVVLFLVRVRGVRRILFLLQLALKVVPFLGLLFLHLSGALPQKGLRLLDLRWSHFCLSQLTKSECLDRL